MLEQKQYEAGSKGAGQAIAYTQNLRDTELNRLLQMAELQNQTEQLRGVDQNAVQSIRERMKALREEQRQYENMGHSFLQKFFSNMQASVQEAGIRIGQKFADAADSVRAAGPSVGAAAGSVGGALSGMTSAVGGKISRVATGAYNMATDAYGKFKYEKEDDEDGNDVRGEAVRAEISETINQSIGHLNDFFGLMRTNATDFWKFMTGVGQEYEAAELEREARLQEALKNMTQEDPAGDFHDAEPKQRSRGAKIGNWMREVGQSQAGKAVAGAAGFVGRTVSSGAGAVSNMASTVASAAAPIVSAIGPVVSALSSSLGLVTSVATPLAAGFGAVAAAAVAPAAAFMAVTAAAMHFTEALNPGLVMLFNMAMRDLSAVIGTGLMPIIQYAVPIMRSCADMLFPLAKQFQGVMEQMMQALAPLAEAYINTAGILFGALMPVFQLLADVMAQTAPIMLTLQGVLQMVISALKPVLELIISLLKPVIQVLAVIMQVLAAALQAVIAPVAVVVQILAKLLQVVVDVIMIGLQPILDVLSGLAQIATILSSALQTVAAGVMALIDSIFASFGLKGLGDGFKDIISQVVAGFQKFVNYMVLAVAQLAKFFGATSMVTGMINSLKGPEKQDTTGLAAAQNPAYKSIEALGKDMALSAAIATGGGGQKKSQDQQAEEMIAALQAIQNGEANNAMVEAINKLPAAIAQAIKQGIGFEGKDTLDAAANMSRAWMPSMITNAGDALGDAVGSAMEYVWG